MKAFATKLLGSPASLLTAIVLGLSLLASPVLAQEPACVSPTQIIQVGKKMGLTHPVLFEGESLKQFKENNSASGYQPLPDDLTALLIFTENNSVWQVVLFMNGCYATALEVPQDVLIPLMDGIKVNN